MITRGRPFSVEFEREPEPFRIETRKRLPEETRDVMLPEIFL